MIFSQKHHPAFVLQAGEPEPSATEGEPQRSDEVQMMPKYEDEATSLLVANVDESPSVEQSNAHASDNRNENQNGSGGGDIDDEAIDATDDVAVPRSNGERDNHLLVDDDLVSLKDDRGEQEERDQIGLDAENATAEVAGTQQEQQQVRITIYRCWACLDDGPHAVVSCCHSWHKCQ